MYNKHPKIIVLDGHDGAGKTTLSMSLANSFDGTYVKPFNDTLGDMIAWLWKNNKFDLADNIARMSIKKILDEYKHSELLIFDRHWMSLFTVLPHEFREHWLPLPSTILIWANISCTIDRLRKRKEHYGNVKEHSYYIDLYKQLAYEYDIPIIDTSNKQKEEVIYEINLVTHNILNTNNNYDNFNWSEQA